MRQRILERLRRRLGRRPGPEAACRVDVLEAALENIAEGAGVVDASGRMIYLNAAAREMCGVDRLQPDPRRWAEAFGLFDVDGVTPFRYEESSVMLALKGETASSRYTVIRNRRHPEGLCVRSHASPIYDDRGRIFGAVFTFRDATCERDGACAARRLNEIVAASPDAIFGVSLDGTVLSWNPAAEKIFGWTATDAVGKRVSMLIPEEPGREVAGELAGQARRGRTVHSEAVFRTKSGRPASVMLISFPARDGEGKLTGISFIARGIQGGRP